MACDTPDGYYNASPRGDRYINVRTGNTVTGIDSYRSVFYNPDVVSARLRGLPDPASGTTLAIQDAVSFIPPQITLRTESSVSPSVVNLSVSIASQSRPVTSIKILVNGRLLSGNELGAVSGAGLRPERASLSVPGNLTNVSFILPLELDPGNNRIEVVAFNGFSEGRRYIDAFSSAPAGDRQKLPDMWIVAVGVNRYDNAGPRLGNMENLGFCVADAGGIIDFFKSQEGRQYGRVNSLLVADSEQMNPTTANIRESFKFLENADPRRDIVVLFFAGHGISDQDGQFYFLPSDAVMIGNSPDRSRAISGDEIMSVLEMPGNRLVFIDACNSGSVDNDRMVRSLMDTNALVFTASRGHEFSYEDPRLGHGFFTYSILTALRGASAALTDDNNVSVLSMSGFVKDDVPRRVLQRYGRQQNPSIYSLGFYDFPMALP